MTTDHRGGDIHGVKVQRYGLLIHRHGEDGKCKDGLALVLVAEVLEGSVCDSRESVVHVVEDVDALGMVALLHEEADLLFKVIALLVLGHERFAHGEAVKGNLRVIVEKVVDNIQAARMDVRAQEVAPHTHVLCVVLLQNVCI